MYKFSISRACDIVDMRGLTKNHVKGIRGEKLVSAVLTRLNIPHRHNLFDYRYTLTEGGGVDISIPSLGIEIEVKNLCEEFPCSKDWIQEEVIDRFSKGAQIKILTISYAKLLTKPAWARLFKNKIKVIEIGEQVLSYSKTAFHNLIRRLSYLCKPPPLSTIRESIHHYTIPDTILDNYLCRDISIPSIQPINNIRYNGYMDKYMYEGPPGSLRSSTEDGVSLTRAQSWKNSSLREDPNV